MSKISQIPIPLKSFASFNFFYDSPVSGSAIHSSNDGNDSETDEQESRRHGAERGVVNSVTPTLGHGNPALLYSTNG